MGTDKTPRLFAKDRKLHVIEYGAGDFRAMSWNDLKHHVMSFNPVSAFQRFVKH